MPVKDVCIHSRRSGALPLSDQHCPIVPGSTSHYPPGRFTARRITGAAAITDGDIASRSRAAVRRVRLAHLPPSAAGSEPGDLPAHGHNRSTSGSRRSWQPVVIWPTTCDNRTSDSRMYGGFMDYAAQIRDVASANLEELQGDLDQAKHALRRARGDLESLSVGSLPSNIW